MGRHSAGDDDEVVEEPVDAAPDTAAALDLASRRGRHASADAGPDDQPTQMIAVVDAEVVPDDRHDTDVLVLPPGFTEGPPPGAVADAPADVPAESAGPSRRAQRAEQRAQKKAAKAAHKVAMAAERQALKRADDEAADRTAVLDVPAAPPAAADPFAEAPTADLPVVDAPVVDAPVVDDVPVADVPVEQVAGTPKKQRKDSGTRADLRLLRRNGAVRARCIAAVLVSFLLYTIVLVVIGRTDVYLYWIWIPIVASGVLVGTFLDLAHRDANKATSADA